MAPRTHLGLRLGAVLLLAVLALLPRSKATAEASARATASGHASVRSDRTVAARARTARFESARALFPAAPRPRAPQLAEETAAEDDVLAEASDETKATN